MADNIQRDDHMVFGATQHCRFCGNGATHIAAQSDDQGKTVTWVPICPDEIGGWNDGGDWKAPIIKLGRRVSHKRTLSTP